MGTSNLFRAGVAFAAAVVVLFLRGGAVFAVFTRDFSDWRIAADF